MNKPEDYKAIRVWHSSTGSFSYYWRRLQLQAAEENAPLNSIYRSAEGHWVTTDALLPDHHFHKTLAEAK